MFNFAVDVFVWTFAIYGFLNIVKEFWVDITCYILKFFIKLKKKTSIKNKHGHK